MVTWSDWKDHLSQRKTPVEMGDLFGTPKKTPPLLWNAPVEGVSDCSVALVERLLRWGMSPRPQRYQEMVLEIEIWLTESKDRPLTVIFALECLAIGYVLSRLSTVIDEEGWWDVLACLAQIAADGNNIQLDQDPLTHQLLAGELALTLAFTFPEIVFEKSMRAQSREALSRGLIDLTDGEGLLGCQHAELIRPLLACWSRAFAMGKAMNRPALNRDARTQYEWLVRQALRLTRGNGTQALSAGSSGAWCPALFKLALPLADDPMDDDAAKMALPRSRTTKTRTIDKDDLPEPFVHSEWAEISVLRPSWKPGGPRLTVAHGNGRIQSELESGGSVLWSGFCDPVFEANGRRIQLHDDWDVVCWFSDADGDYLELEMACDGGWTLQKQFFLAREDRFLLIADAILGHRPARIKYRCQLPLAPGVKFSQPKETTECLLTSSKNQPRCHCLPLALPEWQSDHRYGRFNLGVAGLELEQHTDGQRLYVPLFIDLDPRRFSKPFTWRQLTVGENLETTARDCAVGYRVQVGKKQWLIYRSLAHRRNRTLLGQNSSSECLIARFQRDGTTQALVEIE